MTLLLAFCVLILFPARPGSASDPVMELVMVEREGCVYCARWDTEIAEIYPKTPEGQYAPLRRVDLNTPFPADLDFAAPVIFTPTFILVENGREQGRIEGYAGDELFWAMLTVTLRDHSDFDARTVAPPAERQPATN